MIHKLETNSVLQFDIFKFLETIAEEKGYLSHICKYDQCRWESRDKLALAEYYVIVKFRKLEGRNQ